jgi:hypothetical protein
MDKVEKGTFLALWTAASTMPDLTVLSTDGERSGALLTISTMEDVSKRLGNAVIRYAHTDSCSVRERPND